MSKLNLPMTRTLLPILPSELDFRRVIFCESGRRLGYATTAEIEAARAAREIDGPNYLIRWRGHHVYIC